ncbi:MAG: hypothetical protein MJA28_06410 [Gammaproteobacteria bacterium]|nr:hypothetical protein [Gammaproteobacteria bacterium]
MIDQREQELLNSLSDDDLQERIDDALMLLSGQQARFVRELVKNGGDIYRAGLKAKYGQKSKTEEQRKRSIQQHCSKMLKEPNVWRAYQLLMQQVNRQCIVDVDWWLRENVEFYKECRELVPKVIVVEGSPLTIDEVTDHRNAVSAGMALDRIGKHLGAYKPIEVEHSASESLRKILSDIDGSTTGLPSQSD